MNDANASSRNLIRHLTVAGAAVLSGVAANAQVIVTNVNQNVGFAAGDLSSISLSALPAPGVIVGRLSNLLLKSVYLGNQGAGILLVKDSLVSAGRKFSTIAAGAGFSNAFGVAHSTGAATAKYNDKFLAFEFIGGGHSPVFGWVEGSLTDNTFDNLTVDVTQYAFDESGSQLPTGQTASAVPEPGSEAAAAAFGALTLGAAGVRRLKALKR